MSLQSQCLFQSIIRPSKTKGDRFIIHKKNSKSICMMKNSKQKIFHFPILNWFWNYRKFCFNIIWQDCTWTILKVRKRLFIFCPHNRKESEITYSGKVRLRVDCFKIPIARSLNRTTVLHCTTTTTGFVHWTQPCQRDSRQRIHKLKYVLYHVVHLL